MVAVPLARCIHAARRCVVLSPPSSMKDPRMFDKDIKTLNSLIATTIDSIDGYRESANAVEGGSFAQMFNDRASDRREVLTKLQSEYTRLGDNPEAAGSTAAAPQRGFVNLQSAVPH